MTLFMCDPSGRLFNCLTYCLYFLKWFSSFLIPHACRLLTIGYESKSALFNLQFSSFFIESIPKVFWQILMPDKVLGDREFGEHRPRWIPWVTLPFCAPDEFSVTKKSGSIRHNWRRIWKDIFVNSIHSNRDWIIAHKK